MVALKVARLHLTLVETLSVAEHPVGLEELTKRLDKVLCECVIGNEVGTVGVVGMGGVGKTTLVKAFYNHARRTGGKRFEATSILLNVREKATSLPNGISMLQQKLLKDLLKINDDIQDPSKGLAILRKRLVGTSVLIILDDVDTMEQLEYLNLSSFLGPGSRIIITSRDRKVLKSAKANEIFEMEGLSPGDARLLFYCHAFPQALIRGPSSSSPPSEILKISNDIIEGCKGLPLCLTVIGSLLWNESDPRIWSETLQVIVGTHDILKKLELSYNSLKKWQEKKMFLDIACFFIGRDEDLALQMWQSPGWQVSIHLQTLKDKSLVKVDEENRFVMHDLIRDMGRCIVDNCYESGSCSHLWRKDHVKEVLNGIKRCEKSEVRGLGFVSDKQGQWDTLAFTEMNELCFLLLSNVHITGNFRTVFPKLKWLQWHNFSLDYLPSEMSLPYLKVLDMSRSKLKALWLTTGMLPFGTEVRTLILKGCKNLVELPQFSDHVPQLEHLDLRGCELLETIPDSIGSLPSLKYLDLGNCKVIKELPAILNLCALVKFFLDGCKSLQKLPENIGALKCLKIISLEETALTTLPSSFGQLTSLTVLRLCSCPFLSELPSSLGNLIHLQIWHMSNCPLLEKIPEEASQLINLLELHLHDCKKLCCLPQDIGKLTQLRVLKIYRNPNLTHLPATIGQLNSLVSFDVGGCSLINEGMPAEFKNELSSLENLIMPYNQIVSVPMAFVDFCRLSHLQLDHCQCLQSVSFLPATLKFLDLGDCPKLELISALYSLGKLEVLVLCNCMALKELMGLDHLKALIELNISGCTNLKSAPGLLALNALKKLYMCGTGRLLQQHNPTFLEHLPNLQNVSVYAMHLPNGSLENCLEENICTGREHAKLKLMEVSVSRSDCKAVLLGFVSHDQGWSDFPWDQGRYSQGNTFIEASIEREGQEMMREILLKNRHSDSRDQLHICILTTSHLFVKSLHAGDTICLWARSIYQAWKITVTEGAIRFIYSDQELKQHVQNISRVVQGEAILGLISHLPATISQRNALVSLNIAHCSLDEAIPTEFINEFSSLENLTMSYNQIVSVPAGFTDFNKLLHLQLHHCQKLQSVSFLPGTLKFLDLGDCPKLELITALHSVGRLEVLVLCNCMALKELMGLDSLKALIELNISGCTNLNSAPGLLALKAVQKLYICGTGLFLQQHSPTFMEHLPNLQNVSVYATHLPSGSLENCLEENICRGREHAALKLMEVTVSRNDCKAILLGFVSHDQGWSDNESEHSRYSGGNTFIEASIERDEGVEMMRQLLFKNRLADSRDQLHICILTSPHSFVDSLQAKDTICLWARSRYQAWRITVTEGAIRFIYSDEELQQHIQNISREVQAINRHM